MTSSATPPKLDGTSLVIAANLKAVREEAGITSDEAARRLNLTLKQQQAYEKGQNRIMASRLLDFARLFNVPVSRFYAGLDQPE